MHSGSYALAMQPCQPQGARTRINPVRGHRAFETRSQQIQLPTLIPSQEARQWAAYRESCAPVRLDRSKYTISLPAKNTNFKSVAEIRKILYNEFRAGGQPPQPSSPSATAVIVCKIHVLTGLAAANQQLMHLARLSHNFLTFKREVKKVNGLVITRFGVLHLHCSAVDDGDRSKVDGILRSGVEQLDQLCNDFALRYRQEVQCAKIRFKEGVRLWFSQKESWEVEYERALTSAFHTPDNTGHDDETDFPHALQQVQEQV